VKGIWDILILCRLVRLSYRWTLTKRTLGNRYYYLYSYKTAVHCNRKNKQTKLSVSRKGNCTSTQLTFEQYSITTTISHLRQGQHKLPPPCTYHLHPNFPVLYQLDILASSSFLQVRSAWKHRSAQYLGRTSLPVHATGAKHRLCILQFPSWVEVVGINQSPWFRPKWAGTILPLSELAFRKTETPPFLQLWRSCACNTRIQCWFSRRSVVRCESNTNLWNSSSR